MSKSIRIFYGKELGLKGRCRMNFNWADGNIDLASIVTISAAEASAFGSASEFGNSGGQGQDFSYNLGDADIWVTNISPHQGGVEFILHVTWPDPLNIAVTITVDDQALQQLRVGR